MVSVIDIYIQKSEALISPFGMSSSGMTSRASCWFEGRGAFFSMFGVWDDILKKIIRVQSFFTLMKDSWWLAHTSAVQDIHV